jgi:hypothetical protein
VTDEAIGRQVLHVAIHVAQIAAGRVTLVPGAGVPAVRRFTPVCDIKVEVAGAERLAA